MLAYIPQKGSDNMLNFLRRMKRMVVPSKIVNDTKIPAMINDDPAPPTAEVEESDHQERLAAAIARVDALIADGSPHLTVLEGMDMVNELRHQASQTTSRFRRDLLTFLLDNPAGGPIIEVGVAHGGTTCLLAYVGKVTGRKVYALDIAPVHIDEARNSCAIFKLDAEIHREPLDVFLASGRLEVSPDLIFIDSDHTYNGTIRELRSIYEHPEMLPHCIALHDFNYRLLSHEEEGMFHDPVKFNPIAVDLAVSDFYRNRQTPLKKRIGAFAGDGTTTTRDNPGSTYRDFVDVHGSEGMLLFL